MTRAGPRESRRKEDSCSFLQVTVLIPFVPPSPQVGGRAQRAAGARLSPGARSSRSAPLLGRLGSPWARGRRRRPAGGARDAAGPAGTPPAAVRGAGTGQRELRTDRDAPPRPGPRLARRSRSRWLFVLFLPLLRGPGPAIPVAAVHVSEAFLCRVRLWPGEIPRPEHWPGLWGPLRVPVALFPGRPREFREKLANVACSDLACHPWCIIEAAQWPAQALGQRRGLHLWMEGVSKNLWTWFTTPKSSHRKGEITKTLQRFTMYRMAFVLICIVACLPSFLQRERKHFVLKRVLLLVPEKANCDTRQQNLAKRAASLLPRTCPGSGHWLGS